MEMIGKSRVARLVSTHKEQNSFLPLVSNWQIPKHPVTQGTHSVRNCKSSIL